MKKIISMALLLCSVYYLKAQQGVFAGTHKKWLNQEVVKDKESKFFKGYTYNGSSLLLDDLENELWLLHYSKRTTHIVMIYTKIKDALSYTIRDILEINGIKKGTNTNIQHGTCLRSGQHNSSIIALTKNTKHITAWWIDKDRLKIIKISTKGINCFTDEP